MNILSMNDPIKRFQTCPIAKYHWFKVLSTDECGQSEICKFCGKRELYRFRTDGQLVDTQKYFDDHIRAFAQPSMPVYYDIYPEDKLKFEQQKIAEKRREDKNAELSDKFQFAIKRALDNKDDGITK